MKHLGLAIALISSGTLFCQEAGRDRRQELSALAANLVAQTSVARQAVANHDTAAAQNAIRQALNFSDQMESAAPGDRPLVVTMSSESDAVSTLVPAHKHKANRLKKNAEVSEVSGDYTATTLNVTSASDHLQAAAAALNSGDLEAADRDLAGAQGSVMTKTYSGELPLVEVRQNLAIARTRVQAGDYKNAILPLKSAAAALDRFALTVPGTLRAKRAEAMRIEIDAYADRITKDHVDAMTRVAGWSDQVTDWFNSGMAQ